MDVPEIACLAWGDNLQSVKADRAIWSLKRVHVLKKQKYNVF
jgi:hypothetical protein